MEAGPLSQWLHAGLAAAELPTILIETRHVKAALKAMTVKTDRNDARGMAHLMRMGWFRPVHVKTLPAQEVRALLTARKLLVGKLQDIELGIDEGGHRAATIITILQTAKLNGLNPQAYLTETLTRIADGHPINRIAELLPWATAART